MRQKTRLWYSCQSVIVYGQPLLARVERDVGGVTLQGSVCLAEGRSLEKEARQL